MFAFSSQSLKTYLMLRLANHQTAAKYADELDEEFEEAGTQLVQWCDTKLADLNFGDKPSERPPSSASLAILKLWAARARQADVEKALSRFRAELLQARNAALAVQALATSAATSLAPLAVSTTVQPARGPGRSPTAETRYIYVELENYAGRFDLGSLACLAPKITDTYQFSAWGEFKSASLSIASAENVRWIVIVRGHGSPDGQLRASIKGEDPYLWYVKNVYIEHIAKFAKPQDVNVMFFNCHAGCSLREWATCRNPNIPFMGSALGPTDILFSEKKNPRMMRVGAESKKFDGATAIRASNLASAFTQQGFAGWGSLDSKGLPVSAGAG